MKVFISHKQEDSSSALLIQKEFVANKVETYLDVLDSRINGGGKTLTDHIKTELNSCTDIIVVMSENTKNSWWVPFEIGMSAQVDMPTASFLASNVLLPSYLNYWPRLKNVSDVKKYVDVRRRVEQKMQSLYENFSVASRRRFETPEFYAELKRELETK